ARSVGRTDSRSDGALGRSRFKTRQADRVGDEHPRAHRLAGSDVRGTRGPVRPAHQGRVRLPGVDAALSDRGRPGYSLGRSRSTARRVHPATGSAVTGSCSAMSVRLQALEKIRGTDTAPAEAGHEGVA